MKYVRWMKYFVQAALEVLVDWYMEGKRRGG